MENKFNMNKLMDEYINFWTSFKSLINTPNDILIKTDYNLKMSLIKKIIKNSHLKTKDFLLIIEIFIKENNSKLLTYDEKEFLKRLENFLKNENYIN